MPFYEKRINTPAGTLKSSPQNRFLTVDSGIIHDVNIRFRKGPDDKCHCKILQGGNQIYPTNKSGDFASDGETIDFTDRYEIRPGRNRLTIKTWNTGRFAHDIIVRIGVLKEKDIDSILAIKELNNLMKAFLRYQYGVNFRG